MKKKFWIISIILFFVALIFSILFLLFNEKPNNEPERLISTSSLNSSDSSQMLDSSDSVQQAPILPTLDALKAKHETVIDAGMHTIVTAFYKEDPRVELENEHGEIVELPITSIQEEEQQIRFVITRIETPDSLKEIGDTLNLAYDGETYFEYQK